MANVPRYKMKVITDGPEPMELVALTSTPAILSKGFAFNKEDKSTKMRFSDSKQVIIAPVCRANFDIPRWDELNQSEYVVFYDADECEKMMEAFQSMVKEKKFNDSHGKIIDSAFCRSIWQVADPKCDRATKFGFTSKDIGVGDIMMEVKIKDKLEFEKIKEQGKTGFSLEGGFDLVKMEQHSIMKMDEQYHELADGTKVYTDGWFTTNTPIFTEDKVALTDGDYSLKESKTVSVCVKTFTVKDGVILNYKEDNSYEAMNKNEDKTNMNKEKFVEYKLDGGDVINIDGELVEGTLVYKSITAEDGTITDELLVDFNGKLEDGTEIKTDAEGKIIEIKKVEVEEAMEDVQTISVEQYKADIDSLQKQIAELFAKVTELSKPADVAMSKADIDKSISEAFNKFSEVFKPIKREEFTQTQNKKWEDMSSFERFKAQSEIFNK